MNFIKYKNIEQRVTLKLRIANGTSYSEFLKMLQKDYGESFNLKGKTLSVGYPNKINRYYGHSVKKYPVSRSNLLKKFLDFAPRQYAFAQSYNFKRFFD